MRVGRRLSRGGQVTVDEDRIRGIEAERLERAQVYFSAAGNADFFARIDEAEQAKRF